MFVSATKPADSISRKALLVMGLLLVSLYGLVNPGETAKFPLVGLVVLILWWISCANVPLTVQLGAWVFAALISCMTALSGLYAILGYGDAEIKGVIGPIAGLSAFLIATSRNRVDDWANALDVVLLIHLAAFYAQVVYFVATGEFIDYLSLYNPSQESRVIYHGELFSVARYSGLFSEPTIFSYFIFMAFAARHLIVQKESVGLAIVCVSAMVMSLSISGLILASLTVLMLAIHRGRRDIGTATAMTISLLAPVALLLYVDDNVLQFLVRRALTPLDDPSGYARYVTYFEALRDKSDLEIWFGLGAGNYGFFSVSNSYADIAQLFGVIGLILFVFLFVLLLGSGAGIVGLLVIALSLLQGFLLTTIFWWIFVGLVSSSKLVRK